MKDNVNHPSHYANNPSGIEPINVARHMDFNLGNVLKYIMRAGLKKEQGYTILEKKLEDLKKAAFYLNDEIAMVESKTNDRMLTPENIKKIAAYVKGHDINDIEYADGNSLKEFVELVNNVQVMLYGIKCVKIDIDKYNYNTEEEVNKVCVAIRNFKTPFDTRLFIAYEKMTKAQYIAEYNSLKNFVLNIVNSNINKEGKL